MRRVSAAVVAGLAAALALSGCAGRDASQPTAPAGRPTIVASTDVWGSVAQSVAGSDAEVASVVSGPVDPHSFDPSPAAVAAISDADVVVYNGGGYDTWAADVLDRSPNVASIEAFALLDRAAVGEPEPANVHVFYELGTATAVAGRIADALAAADPAHASGYRSRAAEFGTRAEAILAKERAVRDAAPDAAVVATEPVAHYLLLAAGLTDKTPAGFSNAVEQDTDPAPADLAGMLDLITGRQVRAVVFNDQTVTGATRRIRDAAERAGVPVVGVTETLPAGTDYLTWQDDTADRLAAAVRTSR